MNFLINAEKYKDSESENEGDKVPETYDSDSDPAWTPVADVSQQSMYCGIQDVSLPKSLQLIS